MYDFMAVVHEIELTPRNGSCEKMYAWCCLSLVTNALFTMKVSAWVLV